MRLPLAVVLALAALPSSPLRAAGAAAPGNLPQPDDSALCLAAAASAAAASGVPYDVMMAISLTETGRRQGGALQPWPWAVNDEGSGYWFADRAAALAHVTAAHAAGVRSFDVGCFQLNYRWHGMHFTDLDQMLEPVANAAYAARFLAQLHDEFGDWSLAAGAYHSRTPTYASRYRARFDSIRAGLDGSPPPDALPLRAVAPASARRTRPVLAIHPFLSAPQQAVSSPYGGQWDAGLALSGETAAAPLGSLAGGLADSLTHTLLIAPPGALF